MAVCAIEIADRLIGQGFRLSEVNRDCLFLVVDLE